MSLERENSLLSANFILSSNYFGDAYRCDRALKIFSDRERIARCLTIEAALAKCQGDRGIIPRDAARSIAVATHKHKRSDPQTSDFSTHIICK